MALSYENTGVTDVSFDFLFSILFHSSLLLAPVYLIYVINSKKNKILTLNNIKITSIDNDDPDEIIQLEDCEDCDLESVHNNVPEHNNISDTGHDSDSDIESECESEATIKLKNPEESVNELSLKIQKIIDELSEL